MSADAAHLKAIANYIASLGAKITPHEGPPGSNGANQIGSGSGTTAWPAAVDGAGADAGKAVVTGSAVPLQIPANKNVTHYGIWSGSTFLRGYPLDTPITVNANGPASVDIIPKIRVSG